MRIHKINFLTSTAVLALSIAASPGLVNGQQQSLTSINHDKSSNTLKDSVKEQKTGVAQLIAAVLEKGTDQKVGANLAAVIGLPKPMPTKDVEVLISSQTAGDTEKKGCFVVYETVDGAVSESVMRRPVCAYITRIKRSGLDKETRLFRIDLNGKLEKVVLSQGKYDETGRIVRGSGVKFDQDIESAEVKKAFEAEMKFWLKDWLKKEQRNAAKKTANAAATAPNATAR